MIRHGDYMTWAAEELKGLTPCDKKQATQTAKTLQHISGLPQIHKIVSSTMLRAKETAEIIRAEMSNELVEGSQKICTTKTASTVCLSHTLCRGKLDQQ